MLPAYDQGSTPNYRPLEEREREVIQELLVRSIPGRWKTADLANVRVTEMKDGGMGSLLFASSTDAPCYGRTVSEAWFKDSNGVPVVLSLIVDQNDQLFELDSWKVDFSPRVSLPSDSGFLLEGQAYMPKDQEQVTGDPQ